MTDRELRKLSRVELLELLLQQMKENERLTEEKERLGMKLMSRQIELDNTGSIAEAALKINGVFEAAEAAAAQYVENIKRVQRSAADAALASEKKAEKVLADARDEAERILAAARTEAAQIRAGAQRESGAPEQKKEFWRFGKQ